MLEVERIHRDHQGTYSVLNLEETRGHKAKAKAGRSADRLTRTLTSLKKSRL